MNAPALHAEGITRRYGSRLANNAAELQVPAGTIHGLVGENGAGKSTLCKVLFGLVKPDAGQVSVHGRLVTVNGPRQAMALGLGMVHQHFMLVKGMTVAQNVTLGMEPVRRGMVDAAAALEQVSRLSDRFGLSVDPAAQVDDLPVGVQQRVEILKALHGGARILLLDEPTAVLTPMEVEALFHVLRRLRQEGTTVVMVTHKLGEVLSLCDDVTVMRGGRTVAVRAVADTNAQQLSELMVGHQVDLSRRGNTQPAGEPLLEVRGLRVAGPDGRPRVSGLDLTVRAGEVVGVAGVEGNGQAELVAALAGVTPVAQGQVLLAGEDITAMSVRARMARGLLHVPEDRLVQGLVPTMRVDENAMLGLHHQPPISRAGLLNPAQVAAHAQTLVDAYDVRPPDLQLPVAALSGGNQQKVVVGRAMSARPRVLVVAQPTRGVDVGAMERIHQALRLARDARAGILLISAELSEILSLSDRVVVLYRGAVVHDVEGVTASAEMLGPYMLTGEAA